MKPDVALNIDHKTVSGFGHEWARFDQSALAEDERAAVFSTYFAVFPWNALSPGAEGFDLGCGSGRWAAVVAPRVGRLHCIDPSDAIEVARRNLAPLPNCVLHQASVDDMPLADDSMDFGYSLGVLHHVPDTAAGLRACVRKLKPGAPFLVYLYYAFDNRPWWFRLVWRLTDMSRRTISRLPATVKNWICEAAAALVYFPLARLARGLERAGMNVANLPLSAYRDRSFYTMRTDALDRFGTRLEQRFTQNEIADMMKSAGLDDIVMSPDVPFWCAVGYRRR